MCFKTLPGMITPISYLAKISGNSGMGLFSKAHGGLKKA